jgi:hypothetical protein
MINLMFRKAAQAAVRGDHHNRLETLLRFIREETSLAFPEDNSATTNSFLLELFEKSHPHPGWPVMNEVARKQFDAQAAEIARLRALLAAPQEGNTHQCRKCLFKYTPHEGQSEDCPKCGSDGKDA